MKSAIKFTDHLSFYLYQRIAFAMLKVIKNSPITPNQITVLALLFGLLSAILIVNNLLIYGAVSLQFSFILDCLDGQLARANNQSSKIGMWFDNIVDRVVENAILFSIGYMHNSPLFLSLLIFTNMFYWYISDLEIYTNVKYRPISTKEKILFFMIYFLNRSYIILLLTISIFFQKILYLIFILYVIGIIYRIYRKLYGVIE